MRLNLSTVEALLHGIPSGDTGIPAPANAVETVLQLRFREHLSMCQFVELVKLKAAGRLALIGCPRGLAIIAARFAAGMGFLFRCGCHQSCEAPDFQEAVLKHAIVAQVGIHADIPTRRRILVPHRRSRGVSHQLVQTGNRNQLIPIHPVETADRLVTRSAHPATQ